MKRILTAAAACLLCLSMFSALTPRVKAETTTAYLTDYVQLTTNPFRDHMPSWRPDGSQIVYSAYLDDWNRGIWIMNADGTGKETLTNGYIDEGPNFSPDGTRIAFMRYGFRGDVFDLMIMNADGTNVQRLTMDDIPGYPGGSYACPRWSPDGTKILFRYYYLATGTEDIFVMNTDGTGVQRLGPGSTPHWALGGTKIVFSMCYNPPNRGIYLMNEDGTNVEKLTDGVSDSGPDISPNGLIIFSRDGDLYLVHKDQAGLVKQLTYDGMANEDNEWSPSGEYVVLRSERSGNSDIWKARVVITHEPITVSVDPPLVTGLYPGDVFEVDIYLTGGEAIYAWEFTLQYPRFMQQIAVVDVIEGPYLESAEVIPDGTRIMDFNSPFEGYLIVGAFLLPDSSDDYGNGAYGDGVLATVRFIVIEPAGEFPLDLLSVRLFTRSGSDLIEIPSEDITLFDGYFLGPVTDLVRSPGEGIGKRVWRAGMQRRFRSIVKNMGYAPVWTRLRYTSVRDDGKVITLYSGQHLYATQPRATEYFYVNEFTATRLGWAQTGTSPYLDSPDQTSYVTGDTYCNTVGMFGFQDITLNPGDIIHRVTLSGLVRSASGDIDCDVYDAAINWYGSLWGSTDWAWRNLRWTTDTVDMIYPAVKTQAGFNSFQVMLHYYTPDGSSIGPIDLDCLRLEVEFIGIDPSGPPAVQIQPDTTATLDWAIWDLWSFDVGIYTTTVTLEYRCGTPDPRFPQYWAQGATVNTFTWTVRP